uniref:Uncharacterized protein n=1 Tax=Siphoviridae sp. ctdmY20 TaxID=2825586 RepID=A0A8S5QBA1_9CAUD|nr:MAG TPA: hypothetical protein [Siphoviridae sp. ctdmY20]
MNRLFRIADGKEQDQIRGSLPTVNNGKAGMNNET